ncbi:hypothetical protein MAPG_05074 [Magnaporthiopsis poae ATCC 64411]|uniref:Heterokaryon incompatibility domain-containing protein n=1 Tax=Magnaporthiopsis poae (strain ATCC 64411 / 73-15) TaxID=644358 RepID=A0A0C4DYF3_MAGP6|nr:hypothetical protein MAPG_05074 [Magnaporthiopsis poae ATCC 64411]
MHSSRQQRRSEGGLGQRIHEDAQGLWRSDAYDCGCQRGFGKRWYLRPLPATPRPSDVQLIASWQKHAVSNGGVLTRPYIPADSRNEPLYHRAWTLQERVLSQRVVLYTRHQLLWECQTANLTQLGVPMNSINTIRLPDQCSASELMSRWQVVVTDYSARDLSSSADKLPALSGLAQAFQSRMPDNQYLTGLWETSLLDDLLWCHRPVAKSRRAARGRPLTYRAPSWSWASVDGNVCWLWPAAGIRNTEFYCAEVLRSCVELRVPDNFGEVVGGILVLSGPLWRLDLKHRYGVDFAVLIKTGNLSVYLDYPFDQEESDHDSVTPTPPSHLKQLYKLNEIYLFAITAAAGLVLMPAKNQTPEPGSSRMFKRVGVAELKFNLKKEHWRWFEHKVDWKAAITLVVGIAFLCACAPEKGFFLGGRGSSGSLHGPTNPPKLKRRNALWAIASAHIRASPRPSLGR